MIFSNYISSQLNQDLKVKFFNGVLIAVYQYNLSYIVNPNPAGYFKILSFIHLREISATIQERQSKKQLLQKLRNEKHIFFSEWLVFITDMWESQRQCQQKR